MKATLLIPALFLCASLYAQDHEFNLDKTYSIDRGGTIKMRTNDADITISGSDRSDVHVTIRRRVTVRGLKFGEENFEVEVYADKGDLVIRERSRGGVSMMGYMREEYTIDIEAPSDVSLDINGDDDDYLIRRIDGSIALRIDDGDAELNSCGGKDFYFAFDDGDVKMDKGAGKLYSRADDGNLRITNANFYDVEASVDDGDLEIETSLAENGEYYFRANDADIVLNITNGGGNFEMYHDDSRVSYSRNFEVLREEEDETRLRLRDGSAKVKIRANDAHIRLNDTSQL